MDIPTKTKYVFSINNFVADLVLVLISAVGRPVSRGLEGGRVTAAGGGGGTFEAFPRQFAHQSGAAAAGAHAMSRPHPAPG